MDTYQGRRLGGSMGAIAPITFEKVQIGPIDFPWKQGLKGILHPSIEIPNHLLGILYQSIEIPNDAPAYIVYHLRINKAPFM